MQITRQSSIALTWTPRDCHAVRVAAGPSDSFILQGIWSGEVGKDGASIAELLVHALHALEADDDIYILTGGTGQGWSMTDLVMPSLPPAELKNALKFELHKQTPLPVENLKWAYRITGRSGTGKNAQLHIRLYYVRSEHWNSWMKTVAGFKHIDALLPVPVVLDPFLSGRTFVMPGDTEGAGYFAYSSAENDSRGISALHGNTPLTFSEALPLRETLSAGETDFDALDEMKKIAYGPAIALGLYGLTPNVTADAASGFVLPDNFHAHRNTALKLSALVLGLYLLGMVVFFMAGSLQSKGARIRQVENELSKARRELKALNAISSAKDAARITALMKELQENAPSGPDFPCVMLELTRLIQPPAWISQTIEWHEGKISFQLQSPDRDPGLAEQLEESPVIGDAGERMSSYNQSTNTYTRRFELVARYDTPAEAAAVKMAIEKRKKALKEALSDVKAGSAKGAAEDASSAEDASAGTPASPESAGESQVISEASQEDGK